MIWLDITDPKYALFFHAFLPRFLELDSVLITTRKSAGYEECAALLYHIARQYQQVDSSGLDSNDVDFNALESSAHGLVDFHSQSQLESRVVKSRVDSRANQHTLYIRSIGGYGGGDRREKYNARLERERGFLALFDTMGELPSVYMSGASVEGAQCAFGLGIPIVHFSDTPIAGHSLDFTQITLLARLSLPLSTMIFHPFVVPSAVYQAFGLDSSNVFAYPFIDVALWLESNKHTIITDYEPESIRLKRLGDPTPLVIAREEEYKAHYVKHHNRLWYEGVHLLAQKGARILLIPRYGREHLEREFSACANIEIATDIIAPQTLYAYADLLLGGGGTMTLEACYYGIPTISTRSLLLFHDCYLLEQNLMCHATNTQEIARAYHAYAQAGFARQDVRLAFVLGIANAASQSSTNSIANIESTSLEQRLECAIAEIVEKIASRFYR